MNKILYTWIFFLSFLFMPFVVYADEEIGFSTQQFSSWVERKWEKLRDLEMGNLVPYFKNLPAGTVATVNDTLISLRQVEALGDMELAARGDNRPVSLENISSEYTRYLCDLIEQALIHQELEKRDMLIDDAKVLELEALVRQSYTEDDFEEMLFEDGINLLYWREQLKSRLERESLQNILNAKIQITADEVLGYKEQKKELFNIPEKYTLVLFSSFSKDALEKAHKAGKKESNSPEIFQQERTFALENIPEVWAKDVRRMSVDSLSPVQHLDNTYYYIFLKKKTPAKVLSEIEIYNLAEQNLREAKTEKVLFSWFEEALNNANIRIAPQFLEIIQSTNTDKK